MMINVENLELRNRITQGQIAQVHRDDLDRLGDDSWTEDSQIVSLKVHDPRISSETADQLAHAGLHGVDPPGAQGKEGRREPSRTRAYVEGDSCSNGDRELIQRRRELQIAAEAPLGQNPKR
jgi:hypothetical protein